MIKFVSIAAVLAFFGGAYLGYDYGVSKSGIELVTRERDALQQQVITLKDTVRQQEVLAAEDTSQYLADTAKYVEMERIADELRAKISDGLAFTGPDVDRLRDFWTPK